MRSTPEGLWRWWASGCSVRRGHLHLRAAHRPPDISSTSSRSVMRIPLRQMIDLGRYMRAKKKAGDKYFPLVLMLEPLHACNLACIGCGRIVEYKDTIRDMMPLDEALHSAEDALSPIVSICRRHPLMYNHISTLSLRLLPHHTR